MKSFITKRVISIYVNLRYLGLKLPKYKENNKKISETFDQNIKINLCLWARYHLKGIILLYQIVYINTGQWLVKMQSRD